MKCTACGNECFENEIYPQAVFWNNEKCICEECSIDFEEIDGVIQFRQDLLDDGCVEPVFEEKIMEIKESVKLKNIVSTNIITYDNVNEFYKQLKHNIDLNQRRGEEVEIQYSFNSMGNFYSALILGRKEEN